MKDVLIWGLAVIVGCLVGVVILFAATGSDFFMYKWFAPRQEAVRREVFEQSKAYNEGMAQEIESAQMEYVRATPEQKASLGSIILHKVAGYDVSKLPPDTQAFITQLRRERLAN